MKDSKKTFKKIMPYVSGSLNTLSRNGSPPLDQSIGLFLLIFLFCTPVFAQIDPSQAIKAIVGEAEGEPFEGKVAVAEAIRNRGHLRGVYGLKSPRLAKASAKTWEEAKRAWEASKTSNLVKSADHWENTKVFGVPSWAKKMKKTASIGSHNFYREAL